MGLIAKTTAFPFVTLDLQPWKLQALTKSMMDAGYTYSFGAKISPLSLQATDVPAGHRQVDCSGFVRWVIFHGCEGFEVPDGSFIEHTWFADEGFKLSSIEAGHNMDGAIRIAFLPPEGNEAGHVLFIYMGKAYESHGSHGPDNSRVWGSLPFMERMAVYVLTAPTVAE